MNPAIKLIITYPLLALFAYSVMVVDIKSVADVEWLVLRLLFLSLIAAVCSFISKLIKKKYIDTFIVILSGLVVFWVIIINGEYGGSNKDIENNKSESQIISKTPEVKIISGPTSKVVGKGRMDGNVFKGSIYNGSEKYWVKSIIITIEHKDGTSRDYENSYFSPIKEKLDSSKDYFPSLSAGSLIKTVKPLGSGVFAITTFDTTSKNFSSWYIKSVKVESSN